MQIDHAVQAGYNIRIFTKPGKHNRVFSCLPPPFARGVGNVFEIPWECAERVRAPQEFLHPKTNLLARRFGLAINKITKLTVSVFGPRQTMNPKDYSSHHLLLHDLDQGLGPRWQAAARRVSRLGAPTAPAPRDLQHGAVLCCADAQ